MRRFAIVTAIAMLLLSGCASEAPTEPVDDAPVTPIYTAPPTDEPQEVDPVEPPEEPEATQNETGNITVPAGNETGNVTPAAPVLPAVDLSDCILASAAWAVSTDANRLLPANATMVPFENAPGTGHLMGVHCESFSLNQTEYGSGSFAFVGIQGQEAGQVQNYVYEVLLTTDTMVLRTFFEDMGFQVTAATTITLRGEIDIPDPGSHIKFGYLEVDSGCTTGEIDGKLSMNTQSQDNPNGRFATSYVSSTLQAFELERPNGTASRPAWGYNMFEVNQDCGFAGYTDDVNGYLVAGKFATGAISTMP